MQFRNIEFPFEPVKGVVADLLPFPKVLQCFSLAPQCLESEQALI